MPAVTQHDPDLARDTNNQVMHVARRIRTQDGNTGTPKESPLTVSSTIIEIQVPAEAIELIIIDVSADMRFSEDPTMGRYAVMPANTGLVLQCADGESLYVVRNGGIDVTMQFYFHCL